MKKDLQGIWNWVVAKTQAAIRGYPITFVSGAIVVGLFLGLLVGAGTSGDSDIRQRQADQIADLRDELTRSDRQKAALREEVADKERLAGIWEDVAKAKSDDKERREKPAPMQQAAPEPEPEPDPEPVKAGPEEIGYLLSDINWTVEKPKVKNAYNDSFGAFVELATPEGGFEGPSTRDLNEQAAAVFAEIYGQGLTKKKTVVKFTGGLVDSATGRKLPRAMTGEYEISTGDAKRINWSNEDTIRYAIDWSLYRTFVHPAIKMDD